MRPATQVIEKEEGHPECHPEGHPPPERWFCTRCRREIDGESTVCTVHEGLSGISHINLLGWFPVPFPDENQLIPFRWVCQEPSNPPQQGADGHRLPQKADPRPSVPFVRGSTR